MTDYRKQRYSEENNQKARTRWEFLIVCLLLVPVSVGAWFLWQGMGDATATPPGRAEAALNRSFVSSELAFRNEDAPLRSIPTTYKTKGIVDDQYTVAENDAGHMLIQNNQGGVGTNVTSVEGSRAQLAKDMLELDQQIERDRHQLGEARYRRLKEVVRSGMKLAFGTPGMRREDQPAAKQDLLNRFNQTLASAADPGTTTSGLSAEESSRNPYISPDYASTLDQTQLLSYDPMLFPPTASPPSLFPIYTSPTLLSEGTYYPATYPSASTNTSSTATANGLVAPGSTTLNQPTLAGSNSSTLSSPNLSGPTLSSSTLSSPSLSGPTLTNPTLSSPTLSAGLSLSSATSPTISSAPSGPTVTANDYFTTTLGAAWQPPTTVNFTGPTLSPNASSLTNPTPTSPTSSSFSFFTPPTVSDINLDPNLINNPAAMLTAPNLTEPMDMPINPTGPTVVGETPY